MEEEEQEIKEASMGTYRVTKVYPCVSLKGEEPPT
jgi:hypothetical protein